MSTKKTIIIVVVVVIVLLAMMMALLVGTVFIAVMFADEAENRVVVINLYGPIDEGGGDFFYAGISPGYVRSQLERAAADNSVRGVVLRVNSPGGSVAASQAIASMVRQFEKPLVVSMGDMAASGGYYISAPARGIVAHPGTMTGSIGVITQVMSMDGLYEMLGIEVETIKSGRHKDMFGRTLTDEERELLQALSDEAYLQFITEVSEGRGLDLEEVRELATGELFIGTRALELGLVDRLGGIDEAVAYAAELGGFDNPVRYEYPGPSLFTNLFSYAVRIPGLLERMLLPSEVITLEKVKQGIPPEIRYQVK